MENRPEDVKVPGRGEGSDGPACESDAGRTDGMNADLMDMSQGEVAFPPIEKIRGRVLNDERYFKRLLLGKKKFEASPNFTHDNEFSHILFHPSKALRDQGYHINVLARCEPALCSKKYTPEEVSVLTSDGKHLGMDSKKQLKRYSRGRNLALFPLLNSVDTTGIMAWNDSLGRTANQQGFSRARLPNGQMLFDYTQVGRQCHCVSCLSPAVTGDDIHKPLSCTGNNKPRHPDADGHATSSDIALRLRKRCVFVCAFL